MGAIAKRNCPYCKTRDVGFVAVEEWQTRKGDWRALFICGACQEGVIWEWAGGGRPKQATGLVETHNIWLGQQWPEHASGDAPEDTPATAANYFKQGTSSLEAGNFDASGLMFRKALETATRVLDEGSAGKPLVKRIDTLVSSGKLTSDLGEWAHEVRLGGNEAAHEDEPFTLEDAQDLRNFLENFLRYAFTLPSAVRRRSKPEIASNC